MPVAAGVADALAGLWVGRPRIATIDVDIELEFTKNADGTVNGKLIGTNLGRVDRTLRNFTIADRTVFFTLPNVVLRCDGRAPGFTQPLPRIIGGFTMGIAGAVAVYAATREDDPDA